MEHEGSEAEACLNSIGRQACIRASGADSVQELKNDGMEGIGEVCPRNVGIFLVTPAGKRIQAKESSKQARVQNSDFSQFSAVTLPRQLPMEQPSNWADECHSVGQSLTR